MLGPRMLHGLEAGSFSRRRDISLRRRPWSTLLSSLADTRTSACRIDGSAQQVAPEDLAALERVDETFAAALPEDALAALTICSFCDERRCIDCSMEVFG